MFNDMSIFFDLRARSKGIGYLALPLHVAATRTPFCVLSRSTLIAAYISSTAHSTSLRTFEKLITRPSLCCVHYLSPLRTLFLFLSCPRVYAARLLVATMLEARTHLFHGVTMDESVYLSRDGGSAKVLESECEVLRES